jgi:hypothetical protein
VYRGYSFGAVNGLATDGYLTFSGDEDNPAFISGGGPFHQAIGGSFYLSSAQTRFPCSLTVSFWRTLFPADATTDTALSSNTVTFTCVSGQFFIQSDGVTLNPGDTYTFSPAVPLVGFLAGDPRSSTGTFGGFATCDNTQVAVSARIDWTSSERVHVLHGIVRECYEVGTPCATVCSGSPPPNTIYLTIKNVSLSGGATVAGLAGTYVMTRVPNYCDLWEYRGDLNCSIGFFWGYQEVLTATSLTVRSQSQSLRRVFTVSGVPECALLSMYWFNSTPVHICGTGLIKSGTGGTILVANGAGTTGTFDWEISA